MFMQESSNTHRAISVYLTPHPRGFRIGKKLFKKPILINYGHNSL